VEAAAAGDADARNAFVVRYWSVVRSCLAARWRGSPLLSEVNDAAQEVFYQCFKEGGALERADRQQSDRFHRFLYGIVYKVARKFEERYRKRPGPLPQYEIPDGQESLLRQLDRAVAEDVWREAFRRMDARARQAGPDAIRRMELLRLRTQEALPIREIARRWGIDADELYRAQTRVRKELREALREVAALHRPGTPAEIDRWLEELRDALS
jgi:RNA polymerase sigma factor (sigma-70 family)